MQIYTSKNTSVNVKNPPKIYTNRRAVEIMRGKKVLDYGGGKYDIGVEKAKEYGADVSIYDPYNRSNKHNKEVLGNDYDVAICSNVLNVIDDDIARDVVCQEMAKNADTLLFMVYEGNKSGVGRKTKKDCWQENRKTETYVDEIKIALGNLYEVNQYGKLIEATYVGGM